jgi:hypothetical protein
MKDLSHIAVDPRPGCYYVSVVDGKRHALLAGPFGEHTTALDAVPDTRELAEQMDPRASWYAFGTCRLPDDDSVPIRAGKLNKQLGLPA